MADLKRLRDFGFNTDNSTYVIAEIGINHGGKVETAKKLIESAARTGCDAVKFQTYITEKRTPKDSPIFNILKECELPFEAFKELKDFSNSLGVEFFSTPFDEESIEYLESIGTDLYKLASFDVVNTKLLKKISTTNKPVILSVGMANMDEIKNAYGILSENSKKIALLHCISAYPTEEEQANLASVFNLKNNFNCVIGQSDHTNDIRVPLYAVAAGAQIIEKHFKISEEMDCIDAPVSITEEQMTNMVKEIRVIESILGTESSDCTEVQKGCLQFRRPS